MGKLDAPAILPGLLFALIWSSAFTSAKVALADEAEERLDHGPRRCL